MGLLDFLKRNNPNAPDERFVGKWQLVKSEGDMDVGEGVTMTFTDDGKLSYVIHQKDSDQIMNLVFRVAGDHLVTNQPSQPKEETTRFSFDDAGNLILEYDRNKTWFVRT
jgi:transcriptional/translational regulatory protein YebC/TACO1